VKGHGVQLAMRELRQQFRQPVTLAALAGIAVVMGMSGPFGTLERFALPARMAYWGLVVPMTYAAGYAGTVLIMPHLPAGPRAARMALAALGAAVAVSLVLGVLNIALDLQRIAPRDLALGFVAVYVICLVIEVVGTVMVQQRHAQGGPVQGGDGASAGTPPPLLARLPLDKRGAIWALSAQDHYTTVITERGSALVLIRLSDAIAACRPLAGVQIHRSHWVALAGVARVLRSADGGAEVELPSGARLPVARTRWADLRAAGLVPQSGGKW
jgi:DNA-binding LytR/AlgR family response regulator